MIRQRLFTRPAFLAGLCLSFFFDSSQAQEKFRKSPPIPEPLQELALSPLQSAKLSNGLTLAVVAKSSSPFISIQLLILAGEGDSPEKLPGVASLTANMISRGTERLSVSEIEEQTESAGGEFFVSVSLDQTVLTFNVLEENLDLALSLLSAMVLRPSFPKGQLDSVKRTMFYELIDKEKDAEFVAKRQILRLLCKNHPYRTAGYNEEAIKDIGQKDIIDFYKKYYVSNNAVLVIAGNINLTTAARKISHYFNTWTGAKLDRRIVAPPLANDNETVCFINLPQSKDATIVMGNVIMPLTSPDYFPFVVLNQLLGGTTSSRLFMNLRESKGYAYYAFSEADFYKNCGIFWIRAKVTPDVIFASVQEILKEIEGAGADKISSFEIEQAKSFLIGNFPLKNEPLSHYAFRASQIVAFDLGDNHWNKYYENIIQVNLDKVRRMAQEYYHPKPVVVVVGNAERILEYLRNFEKVDIYDLKGVKLMTATKGVEE